MLSGWVSEMAVLSLVLTSINSVAKSLGSSRLARMHGFVTQATGKPFSDAKPAFFLHEMNSSVLLQEALWSVMFWSYIPLVALGITTFAFAVKMPIEARFFV